MHMRLPLSVLYVDWSYAEKSGLKRLRRVPRGRTTAILGSANEDDCVSPELNFAAGFIAAMIIPLALECMVHGRFRGCILRHARVVNALVNDSTKIVKDLYQFVSLAEAERKRRKISVY